MCSYIPYSHNTLVIATRYVAFCIHVTTQATKFGACWHLHYRTLHIRIFIHHLEDTYVSDYIWNEAYLNFISIQKFQSKERNLTWQMQVHWKAAATFNTLTRLLARALRRDVCIQSYYFRYFCCGMFSIIKRIWSA
jgi:hypothetical protein